MTQYEIPIESKKKKSARIPIDKLHDFDGHPFKVTDNEDMDKLVESIKSQGIINPLIVRLKDNTIDEYEVISGHRRLHASKRAGLTEVPALIYPYTKTEAAIAVVDSNLHRERILPSEKAFAYKMKMEALKEQGKRTDLTSSQVATKSDTATEIGKAVNESRDQVFRYIRLTNLIPELLQLVDEERIALTPAVELSYLKEQEQYDLLSTIESEDCTPSLSQSIRLKKLSQVGQLNADKIFAVMSEEKANQKERISFPFEDVRRFFPKSYTQKDVYNAILKLIGEDYQRRERARKNRDER